MRLVKRAGSSSTRAQYHLLVGVVRKHTQRACHKLLKITLDIPKRGGGYLCAENTKSRGGREEQGFRQPDTQKKDDDEKAQRNL